MRYKKLPLPFNFRDIADAESSVYTDDRNMEDVTSNRGTMITANKIKNKYKKMRAKNNSLPFVLDEIEQAETENHVDNIDIANVTLNRNAAITAKKLVTSIKRYGEKEKEQDQQSLQKKRQKGQKQTTTQKSQL